MEMMYLAQSLDELEEQAKFPDEFRKVLNDAHACNTLYKREFADIGDKMAMKDEELACVLCIQLEKFLQRTLDIATNVNYVGDGNCHPNGQKWEATLTNHLRRVKERLASLKKGLKSRYEKRIAKQNDALRFIRALFSDQQSLPGNDQSFRSRSAKTPNIVLKQNNDSFLCTSEIQHAVRPGSSTMHSSNDLAVAALNDLASYQKVDTYLGSSIADLDAPVDDWKYLPPSSVDTCILMGERVLEAIDIYKVQGDEEMQFVLNKLLAAYMQQSKDALHNGTNGEQDDTDKAFFESYIDPAQGRCKLLEESLNARYAEKLALKRKASYVIQSRARLEDIPVSKSEPTPRSKSNLLQLELNASAEMAQSMQQIADVQPDEKLCILSSQPSAELHSPFEAPIAQALDDIDIGSLANAGRYVRERADHALAAADSLAVLTSAASAVAADADSVTVAAAFATAAVAGQETTSGSPAAIGDTALARTNGNNASVANTRCLSLPGIAGIVNRRNECYMISILQVFNSLPGFHESINEIAQHGSHRLASEVAAILRRLKDGTVGDLQELKNVLGTMNNGEKWAGDNQQDAHEFFMYLCNMLEQNAQGAPDGKADSNRPTGARLCFVKEQIEFTVRTSLKCNKCDKESLIEEPMHFFPIDIACDADKTQVIPDCLKTFTQPESVPWGCGHSITKTADLCSLPHVLILYVKRFARRLAGELTSHLSPTVDYKKLTTAIKFPTENLDLRPLMARVSEASNYGVYRLTGIVNHQGEDMESGHYTAHCKNLNDGLWYLFNDRTVTPYPVANASATDAYILFYSNCSLTARQR